MYFSHHISPVSMKNSKDYYPNDACIGQLVGLPSKFPCVNLFWVVIHVRSSCWCLTVRSVNPENSGSKRAGEWVALKTWLTGMFWLYGLVQLIRWSVNHTWAGLEHLGPINDTAEAWDRVGAGASGSHSFSGRKQLSHNSQDHFRVLWLPWDYRLLWPGGVQRSGAPIRKAFQRRRHLMESPWCTMWQPRLSSEHGVQGNWPHLAIQRTGRVHTWIRCP